MPADIRIITIGVDELEALIEAAVARALAAQREGPTEWLDAPAAAKLLGVSARTVTRMAQRHKLPCTRVGGLLRFSRTAIDEHLRRA